MKADLLWNQDMQFTSKNRDFNVTMDASSDHGGHHFGPTPKELVLDAMMGCTAMDVVSVLTKMRQTIDHFSMTITVEKNTEPPIYFKAAHLTYILKGNIQLEKALKAIDSSLTKYCGVNYMISKVCHITYSLHLNDQEVHQGEAKFIDPKN